MMFMLNYVPCVINKLLTLSIDELEDLAKEHAHESAKAGQVQVVDYGDLVTDQLGEEGSDGE